MTKQFEHMLDRNLFLVDEHPYRDFPLTYMPPDAYGPRILENRDMIEVKKKMLAFITAINPMMT